MKYILTVSLILLMQTVASAQFLKASRVPDKAFSLYQKDGSTLAVEITLADYSALSLPNSGEPPRSKEVTDPSWKWMMSYQRYIFDTPSGELEQGYISDAWKNYYTFTDSKGNLVGVSTSDTTGVLPNISTVIPVQDNGKSFSILNGQLTETAIPVTP